MTSCAGRVALVTGGARGIGHAIGAALVRDGAAVFAADIQPPASSACAGIRYLRGDVSDPAAMERLLQTIEGEVAGVDLLVNNAGILDAAQLAGVTREMWARTMRINLEAPFFVAQRAAATMERLGRGVIVNISSTSAFVSSRDQAVYEISKAGVAVMTRALAIALAPRGIRVNAVAPGLIDTDMTRALFADPAQFDARVRSKIPLGRAGRPEDIADAVRFLASDDADYVTGQTLVVDGGWVLT